LALVVFVLNLARIPLRLRFSRRALAIGVGFGAQTVIKISSAAHHAV